MINRYINVTINGKDAYDDRQKFVGTMEDARKKIKEYEQFCIDNGFKIVEQHTNNIRFEKNYNYYSARYSICFLNDTSPNIERCNPSDILNIDTEYLYYQTKNNEG